MWSFRQTKFRAEGAPTTLSIDTSRAQPTFRSVVEEVAAGSLRQSKFPASGLQVQVVPKAMMRSR